jgi:hypothetical protein
MSNVEDRTRAAMDAVTAQVDGAPPLPLPPPDGEAARRRRGAPAPRRRWGPWLAPAAAAAAVIAIAAAAVIVRNAPAGEPAGQPAGQPIPAISAPPGYPADVPPYYVAIPGHMSDTALGGPEAVVYDTFTGKRLAALSAPAGWTFVSVAAAADDRTFVVGATHSPKLPDAWLATRWYVIRVTPGAVATLRQLSIPASAGAEVEAMALSPDDTRLAMMSEDGPAVLRVYSVATGAVLHTWTTSLSYAAISPPAGPLLFWTADGQLAFQWRPATAPAGVEMEIRTMRVSDPGHDLLADSRPVWSGSVFPGRSGVTGKHPLSCGGTDGPSVLVAGGGKTIVCGASGVFRDPGTLPTVTCPAAPPWNDEGVLQYSAVTGKLAGTLYRSQSSCVPASYGPLQLLWTSASGDAAIGYFYFGASDVAPIGYVDSGDMPARDRPVIRFGLFTAGRFTPLPAPPTITTDPAFTAW